MRFVLEFCSLLFVFFFFSFVATFRLQALRETEKKKHKIENGESGGFIVWMY